MVRIQHGESKLVLQVYEQFLHSKFKIPEYKKILSIADTFEDACQYYATHYSPELDLKLISPDNHIHLVISEAENL